jgi:hypothetical protein
MRARKGFTHSWSKIAIIRDANGFVAICGICKNSSRSMDPDPSLINILDLAVTQDEIVDETVPVEFHEPLLQPF